MTLLSKRIVNTEMVVSLLLAAITLLTYLGVGYNGFIEFDDNKYVTENVHLHKGISFESIKWAFTSCDIDYWHPLTWMSHMLDFQLFGLHAGMHHFVNVLFHWFNAVLLFIFLFRETGFAWKSFLVAGFFAVHPLNVESVAWVAERKNVLSTFFWMFCIITYGHYTKRLGMVRYLCVLLIFCLGLMCKPMVVTLPFVLLLVDYWPLRRFQLFSIERGGSFKKEGALLSFLILEKIPFIIISIAAIAFFIQSTVYPPDTVFPPLKLKIYNAIISYVKYIGKVVCPTDFSVFYPYPESVPFLSVLAAIGFLLSITYFMIKVAASRPYMIVGWLWYLGTLVPVLGIVQNGLWPEIADRFVYIPMIGLLIMAVWGIFDGIRIRLLYPGVAAGVILVLLTMTSAAQVRNWKNSKALFEHAIGAAKNNWLAHSQLGAVLAREGDMNQAVFHLKTAALYKPMYTLPLFNLAGVYNEKGNSDAAMSYYRRLLKIKPAHSEARNNLGVLLHGKGDFDDAMRQYKIAISANPKNAKAHCNIANLLSEKGKLDEAVSHYLEAIRIDPRDADFHYNLGGVLLKQKRTKEAMYRFSETIIIKPDYAPAYYQIGLLFIQLGDNKSARLFFEKAIQLDPHSKEAKYYLDELSQ